ncbi:LytR/AlgR family response regulator transcription factor [Spirosoma endophyticum]|uniref:Transcriptional regulator, LytTR family n=1 Tax=Spirosoma endophyticum TaxID=662367 RepID=A0A1I1SGZ8_9BACT|nr:LytTR family DNA-binding domain-containing protein [Spirosoma endophyticum]SFD45721.1 transcriptional regulator, LytTR family [Spirosoma endophyticum]
MNTSVNQPTSALKMHVRNTGKITLPFADLMFLQATGNYSWLHWKDGQRMLLPRTLKYYEPQLPIELFVRAHRSCIINIHYIERMVPTYPDRGGFIHLRSGDVLPVSRRRWVAIRKIYQSLPSITDRYTLTGKA